MISNDMIWYDIWYDIIWYLLTEVCFPQGGSVGKIVHKYKINNCIHGERQYTKQDKNTEHTTRTEQNVRKKKTNIKRVNLKNHKIIN